MFTTTRTDAATTTGVPIGTAAGRPAPAKLRQQTARTIERALIDADRRFPIGGIRWFARPSVVQSCASSLGVIRDTLRDESVVIDEATVGAVRSFLLDPTTSPFYKADRPTATAFAERLARRLGAGATSLAA